MGLTEWLRSAATRRPHVLLVPVPGGTQVRLAAQRLIVERGWVEATSPAGADVVLVCGTPDVRLGRAVDMVWEQLPGPRARISSDSDATVADALDDGVRQLDDLDAQRRDAGRRVSPSPLADDEPGDLPMADRAEDRDGLKLDQLHIQLGPVLPDWPAGLVMRVALQGDVIQHSAAEVWGGHSVHDPFWDAGHLQQLRGEPVTPAELRRRLAAAHLDSAARMLALAGWDDAATAANRVRDLVLGSGTTAEATDRLTRLHRRVRRSRLLRWSTSGLGVLDRKAALARGITGPALRAGGDGYARLCQWLTEAQLALRESPVGTDGPRGRLDGTTPPSQPLLDVLPGLTTGLDLATARLVIASLDPDPDELLLGAAVGQP